MHAPNPDMINRLRKEILSLQGFGNPKGKASVNTGLDFINNAFPNQCFPTGAMHELIINNTEAAAATKGFIVGLASGLMQDKSVCVWISASRNIFPPALGAYGVKPEQVIFIDVKKEKDALWAMEEVLKCEGFAAVVGEIQNIDFTASRRLQLAVEQSRVTGFILRHQQRNLNTIACIARWHITSVQSELQNAMPGVGFPRWHVSLLKVRNGRPGAWDIEWNGNNFREVVYTFEHVVEASRKAG